MLYKPVHERKRFADKAAADNSDLQRNQFSRR
jgi:hypothetical protein